MKTRAFGCWILIVMGGWLLMGSSAPAQAQPLDLILPTANDALLYEDGPAFYQYTDRYFQGRRLRPWQGGKYGFVRNPKETAQGIIYTRLHEGVDIKVVRRDARGEPLDEVRAIDEGRVVYANAVPSRSSYGNYVVVEHWWSGAPFYSLYAHLGRVDVEAGERVEQGATLGRVGYTGRGINRRRAHVHFEIGMLLNQHFGQWYDENYRPGTNRHGVFNGLNLRGIDVAALYQELHRDPTLTIGRFLTQQQEPFYTVHVAREGTMDLLSRYPWLLQAERASQAATWAITFTRVGVPIRVEALAGPLEAPSVQMAAEDRIGSCSAFTMGVLRGQGGACTLSGRGQRFIDLLMAGGDGQPPVHPALAGEPSRDRANAAW